MANRVDQANATVIRQCRQQAGLRLSVVQKKVPRIDQIERGELSPTFRQLDTLSELYGVPRWVFIAPELPTQYKFDDAIPAFRQFATRSPDVFDDSQLRRLTAKVDRLRGLMVELLEDLDESQAADFDPPSVETDPRQAASAVRSWLDARDSGLEFEDWRGLIEDKGVFVFVTSKYLGWSHLEKDSIRGLSIYHEKLPVIVVNDSDARKAQSFTLLHELGHLIRRENAIDDWTIVPESERWCDELAGNILMPEEFVMQHWSGDVDLDSVKRIARTFQVSSYASLVRLRQLNLIAWSTYQDLENELRVEYAESQAKMRGRAGGPARNRPKEVVKQYGRFFTGVLFQAYHNKELGLHKLSTVLDLRRPSHAFEVRSLL